MGNFYTPFVDTSTDGTVQGTLLNAGPINQRLDELAKAITYNRPKIVSCDGAVTWNATTGALAWSGALRFVFNREDGTAILNTVATGSVTLADNQFAYVTLNEYNETALTVSVGTVATGSASNFLNPQVFVLGYRNAANDDFISIGLGDLLGADTTVLDGRVTAVEDEVETARGGAASLDARLDAMDEEIDAAASSGPVASVNGKTGAVTLTPSDVGVATFCASLFFPGTYTAGQKLAKVIPTIACSIPANLAGTLVSVDINPTATAVIPLKKNGVEFGTITIATDGSVTLASSSGATINGTGDYIEPFAPTTADTTLAGVSINIAMLRG